MTSSEKERSWFPRVALGLNLSTKRQKSCSAHPPRSTSLDRSIHLCQRGLSLMRLNEPELLDANGFSTPGDDLAPNGPKEKYRRTILIERHNGSYGFTLQSYGIQYHPLGEIEVLTYVDHVDEDGSAYAAGLQPGDVILSINGQDMERADHHSLVSFIQNCNRLRMVVLYEDCVRKVELHMRYITLAQSLQDRDAEFKKLCHQEQQLISDIRSRQGVGCPPLDVKLGNDQKKREAMCFDYNYLSMEDFLPPPPPPCHSKKALWEKDFRQSFAFNHSCRSIPWLPPIGITSAKLKSFRKFGCCEFPVRPLGSSKTRPRSAENLLDDVRKSKEVQICTCLGTSRLNMKHRSSESVLDDSDHSSSEGSIYAKKLTAKE